MRYQTSGLLAGTVLIVVLVCTACNSNQAGGSGNDLGSASQTPVNGEATQETPGDGETTPLDRSLTLTPAIAITPSEAQVPAALLEAMISDLARKREIEPANITVLEAQEVVWNDGSLGCPERGKSYTMAEVPGYYVVLQENGIPHYYHASAQTDHFIECEVTSNIPVEPNK